MIGRKGHEISLDFQKNSKNIIFYLTDSWILHIIIGITNETLE
jgi:hypothetical protein